MSGAEFTRYIPVVRKQLENYTGQLNEEVFERILRVSQWKELPGKSVLFRENDPSDGLYLLVSGRLEALRTDSAGNWLRMGEITEGQTVGEMAVIMGDNRSATVRAIRDSILIWLPGNAFDRIANSNPQILRNITRLLVKRVQNSQRLEKPMQAIRNLCLFPLHDSLDIEGFSARLSAALSKFGKVKILRFSDVPQELPGSGDHQLTQWLNEQESEYRFILYAASGEDDHWTRKCLRQADEILILADAGFDPKITESEQILLIGSEAVTYAPKQMVMLHSGGTVFPGTERWLNNREFSFHHHLNRDDNEGYQRLARFISGQSVGLVLSGGGARGFAHMGVFKALQEAGIPVDLVGGTSIGAVMGAQIAMLRSPDEMINANRIGFRNPTSDFNLIPYISLLRGRKIDRLLKEHLGDLYIEDLPLRFFAYSANLSTSAGHVFRRGLLTKAIRASLSLPGIFPPVIHEGELFVDGGLVNNLPVDVMAIEGAGKIISSDLDFIRTWKLPETEMPRYRDLILSRLKGRRRDFDVPGMMTTLIQSTTIASDGKTRAFRDQVDLYLNPDVSEFGLLDWKRFDEIIDKGYRYTMQQLEKNTEAVSKLTASTG